MPPLPLGGFDGSPDIPSGGDLASANPLPLDYAAPRDVRDIIASLGRTEDLRFAPNGRRLAIASAVRDKIILIDLDISVTGATPHIALTHAVEISSPCLKYPHGLEFLDDSTLIVANRRGGLAVFDVSLVERSIRSVELTPIQMLPSTQAAPLQRPGSLALLGSDATRCEILVCNNSGHNITRHALDRGARYAPIGGEILLEKWLDIPDGIAASHDQSWIAVSNHNGHCVLLYENRPGLDRQADPDGLLRGLHAPHGLRFSPDGRTLFVADAGTPYVHIYADDRGQWRGIRYPNASISVIDPQSFRCGRYNAREGGPKGIDVDRHMTVLVTTSEWQPLAFFDLPPLLAGADGQVGLLTDHGAMALRYEVDALGLITDVHRRVRAAEKQANQATANEQKALRRLEAMTQSVSWRLTAPLRWLRAALRRGG